MACSGRAAYADCLQFASASQCLCCHQCLPRSLSCPLPTPVVNSQLCLSYQPVDISLGKFVLHRTKSPIRSARTSSWTTSVLKQRFKFARISASLDPGSGNVQDKEKRSLLVSASSTSYGGTLEEGMLNVAGISFSKENLQMASVAAIAVVLTVANKVLYKMALVPLKNYPFFLALINTFGYVLVYFSILHLRYRAGIVTDEMLELPKSRFVAVGALEALAVAVGMAAAAILPGAALPLLIQTFLVWQLILSMVFLKKRYSFGQIMGCIMVMAGVVIALASSAGGSASALGQIGLFWPLMMILSSAFQACSSILKEFVFRDAAQRLKGGSVDLFVVNSFGSGFQALFVLLMLPFLSKVRGIPFSQLPMYLKDGAACLFNIGSMSTECNGAPLLTFLYVVVNMAFNISVLSLLKLSSAVVSSLCTTIAVPLSIYMFTLPLPYVGTPASLPPQFLVGVAVLLAGLAFYNFSGQVKNLAKHE